MVKQMLVVNKVPHETAYENSITKLCHNLGLKVNIGENVLCINSGFSRWMLIMQDDYTVKEAWHENHRFNMLCTNSKRKTQQGYHKQTLYSKSLPEVLKYIRYHDKANLNRGGSSIFDLLKAS